MRERERERKERKKEKGQRERERDRVRVCREHARTEYTMVVRLRLARFGRYKFPFYRIYAADHRAPRDGKHLEILGHYDPIPQVVRPP